MKVSEVNNYIKKIISFDPILNSVFIEGEISNFKLHSSGHAYFSLKDDNSKINCVMFQSNFNRVNFNIIDGMKVEISGNVSVYERDGKYQLYVETLKEIGIGDLYKKFTLLKEELKKEGYFDKFLEIPKFPTKIGVITSKTGAAIRDIITVLTRRNNSIEIIIYPVHVQGDKAKFEISRAIDYFNETNSVDLIILSRGGGSIEELWAFNELMVIESMFDSLIPIISGVGHETDFTISDFVADKRAATPSEAAELAVESSSVIMEELIFLKSKLLNNIQNLIKLKKLELESNSYIKIYKIIDDKFKFEKSNLVTLQKELINNMDIVLNSKKIKLNDLVIKLNTMSPLNTLNRGYAIIEKNNKNITSVDMIEKSDVIDIILNNGIIKTKVISKERKKINE